MNSIITFWFINLLIEPNDEHLLYLFILSLIFDLVIYYTLPYQTIFFLLLILLNRKLPKVSNLISYILRFFMNHILVLLFYLFVTQNIIVLSKLLPAVIFNLILAIIMYYFRKPYLSLT